MAKDNERKLAKQLYMNGKLQKEIAAIVNVREKTIGNWASKHNWKTEREARFGSSKKQVENIKAIISTMAEERLQVHNDLQKAKTRNDGDEIERLQKEAAKLDDGVSKWNKTLENLDKDNRVSLATYIEIMEDIFKDLQDYDPKLFLKTLDFQEQHLTKKASKY